MRTIAKRRRSPQQIRDLEIAATTLGEAWTAMGHGAKAAVAAEINRTPQAVCQWKVVPPDFVLQFEKISGFSRHRLRPDLYPLEP